MLCRAVENPFRCGKRRDEQQTSPHVEAAHKVHTANLVEAVGDNTTQHVVSGRAVEVDLVEGRFELIGERVVLMGERRWSATEANSRCSGLTSC
jgi:hypothetical protein